VPKVGEAMVGECDELVNFGGWGCGHWFSSNEITKSYNPPPRKPSPTRTEWGPPGAVPAPLRTPR
jgi:hypothetical protein